MDQTVTHDWRRHSDQLRRLAGLNFNFDVQDYEKSTDKMGWKVDRHHALIATEAPGEPVAGGVFERCKSALNSYEFPDPRLITGIFDPRSDLGGRNMLLRARFLGFTFFFGVRVTSVVDEIRFGEHGEPLRVWGYSYRTLKGHFEIGEILFEIAKNLENGQVTFEINAYSKPDRIPNFFYRAGFRLFGRSLQKYFARSSIRRLRRLAARPAAVPENPVRRKPVPGPWRSPAH